MKTRPWLWSRRICPVRHLKKVLLPAPFGPIRQRSSRSAQREVDVVDRLHAAEAHRQVARVEHGLAHEPVSPLAAPAPRAARLPPADARQVAARAPARERRQQAARQQQHDEDQDRAEHQRVVDQRLLAEQQLQVAEDDRADDRPDQRAEAADDRPDDDLGRLAEAEHAGRDDLGPVREQAAGEPGHAGADREDRGLVAPARCSRAVRRAPRSRGCRSAPCRRTSRGSSGRAGSRAGARRRRRSRRACRRR